MVRKYPDELRRRVVELWLDGCSYRRISKKLNVSIGWISPVIKEEREKAPDIDVLRYLNKSLKDSGLDSLDAIRGATLINKMNKLDINIDDIPKCLKLSDSYGEKAGDVLRYTERLMEIENSRGKSYEEILSELAEKIIEKDRIDEEVKQLEQRKRLSLKEIEYYKLLKELQEKLDTHGIRHEKLDEFIDRNETLEELGFTPLAAETLASELKNMGLDPTSAALRLASLLDQYLKIETALRVISQERDIMNHELKKLKIIKEEKEKELKEIQNKAKFIKEYTDYLKNEVDINLLEIQNTLNKIEEIKIMKIKLEINITGIETKLEILNEKIRKNRNLGAIVTLLSDPMTDIEPTPLLEAMIAVTMGFMLNVFKYPKIVPMPKKLLENLDFTYKTLSRQLSLEKRTVF